VFGTPKDRATFTFEGDTPGTSFMLTGIFEDRASNAAQWARFGANWTQSHGTAAGYLRDGDVVTKVDPATGQDVQLAPNTEANRLNIIARAWMDSVDDTLAATPPTMYVWINGGHVFYMDGSPCENQLLSGSPNDAVRDYLSTTDLANTRDRVLWSYTNAWPLAEGGDTPEERKVPTAGVADWQWASVQTMIGRGIEIAMQLEAEGGHPTTTST